MKKILALVSLTSISALMPAFSADLIGMNEEPTVIPVVAKSYDVKKYIEKSFDFYAGIQSIAVFSKAKLNLSLEHSKDSKTWKDFRPGFAAGLHVGTNYYLKNILLGVEASANYTKTIGRGFICTADNPTAADTCKKQIQFDSKNKLTGEFKANHLGSIEIIPKFLVSIIPHIGYRIANFTPYIGVGGAYASFKYQYISNVVEKLKSNTSNAQNFGNSQSNIGFAAKIGTNYKLSNNLMVKGEIVGYRFKLNKIKGSVKGIPQGKIIAASKSSLWESYGVSFGIDYVF